MATKKLSNKAIKAELRAAAIDPYDPVNWDKPLWVIYDYECFPSMLCCKINAATGTPCIWGYSVYKNSPGFRTIGTHLIKWMFKSHEVPRFFDIQVAAINYLIHITTPRCKIR
jgi:hypothetical protein